jgi:mannose-6-phosphate isomerase-like protein (cupin superfamily)
MIIRGSSLPLGDRQDYGLGQLDFDLRHFVIRTTTPGNPFAPHEHDGAEYWFILDGQALVSIDGNEYSVQTGDLVLLPARSRHGLRSTGSVRWICLG